LSFRIRLLRLFVSRDIGIINPCCCERLLRIFAGKFIHLLCRLSYRGGFCRSITHLGILDLTVLYL
jgi:hypothetical protein